MRTSQHRAQIISHSSLFRQLSQRRSINTGTTASGVVFPPSAGSSTEQHETDSSRIPCRRRADRVVGCNSSLLVSPLPLVVSRSNIRMFSLNSRATLGCSILSRRIGNNRKHSSNCSLFVSGLSTGHSIPNARQHTLIDALTEQLRWE